MTVSPYRAVAPVSAVCAAFAAQPSGVPAQRQKIGRCADVRERPTELQRRRKSAAGDLQQRAEPRAARQEKAKVSCAHLGRHNCPQCGQFGAFGQGLFRGQKQPCWGRKCR